MDRQELLIAAEAERGEKAARRNEEVTYYGGRISELNLSNINRFVSYHPEPSEHMREGTTFAHRDLEAVTDAMANNESWSVVSGLNPSAPLHMGHKQVFDELLWCQRQGAEIFIPITNDESFLVGKSRSVAEARKIAYEKVIPDIVAMGFDPATTHIFLDSDYTDIYNFAIQVSREISLNKVSGVFGFDRTEEGENVGTVFYRAGVQLAQILLPQLVEFGGRKPTLIPVGIDQYPYIHLARDVARKLGMTPPSAIFTKFEQGLDGKGKMSASRTSSALFLDDDEKTVKKKIKSAYTGGSLLGDFQKEHGGIPEICPIFQLRSRHFEGNEELFSQCSNGEILCGECKNQAIGEVTVFLAQHQERVADNSASIDEFMLDTPLRSLLEE